MCLRLRTWRRLSRWDLSPGTGWSLLLARYALSLAINYSILPLANHVTTYWSPRIRPVSSCCACSTLARRCRTLASSLTLSTSATSVLPAWWPLSPSTTAMCWSPSLREILWVALPSTAKYLLEYCWCSENTIVCVFLVNHSPGMRWNCVMGSVAEIVLSNGMLCCAFISLLCYISDRK